MGASRKYLKTAAALAITFSAIIFIIVVVYTFLSMLTIIWISFLIFIALVELIVFLMAILFFLNPQKRIFFVGLISLFAFLIPGIMILSFYFKTKNTLLRNFELSS